MMIWSKVVVEEVVRRGWIMCIYLKVEYVGFADRLDDDVKEREESVITKVFALRNWRSGVIIYSDQEVLEFGLGCIKLEMPISDIWGAMLSRWLDVKSEFKRKVQAWNINLAIVNQEMIFQIMRLDGLTKEIVIDGEE